MSLPRYKEYKDSGVEWLGMVPINWSLIKSKWLFRETSFRAKSLDEQLAVTQKYGVIPQKLFMEKEDQKVVLALKGTDNFKHVSEGDFVISLRSFQGGIENSTYSGCVSPAYTVLKPDPRVITKFWIYLFKCNSYIEALNTVTVGIREGRNISYDQFGKILVPLCSQIEQRIIASFLDRETSKIDSLISEQEKLIELLKEKRQAIISHAVTKGLNPDVEMKDSGVEWLGMVPKGWGVKRLRFVAKLNPSKSELSALDRSTLVSFLPMQCIGEDGTLQLENEKTIGELEKGYTYFRDGDVTIAKITPCYENGKGGIMRGLLNGVGFGTTELIVIRPLDQAVTPSYLQYLFTSSLFRKIGESHMYGAGGQKRVPDSFVRDFFTAFPSYSEQIQISSFLDHETSKIDALTTEALRGIDLLKERRSVLISAAVTGQIDVRNFVSKDAA